MRAEMLQALFYQEQVQMMSGDDPEKVSPPSVAGTVSLAGTVSVAGLTPARPPHH
jgi:hypothetical protein